MIFVSVEIEGLSVCNLIWDVLILFLHYLRVIGFSGVLGRLLSWFGLLISSLLGFYDAVAFS